MKRELEGYQKKSGEIKVKVVEPFILNLRSKLANYQKRVILCHNDADGICAGVLAKKLFPGAEFIAKSHVERKKFNHDKKTLYLYVDIQPHLNPKKVPENIFCIDHHALMKPKGNGYKFLTNFLQNNNYFVNNSQGTGKDTVSTATTLVEYLNYAAGIVDYDEENLSFKDFANDTVWKKYPMRKELILCGVVTDNAQHIADIAEQKRVQEWFENESQDALRDYSIALSLALGTPEDERQDSFEDGFLKEFVDNSDTNGCLGIEPPARFVRMAENLIKFVESILDKAGKFWESALNQVRDDYSGTKDKMEKTKVEYHDTLGKLFQQFSYKDFKFEYDDEDIVGTGKVLDENSSGEEDFRRNLNGVYALAIRRYRETCKEPSDFDELEDGYKPAVEGTKEYFEPELTGKWKAVRIKRKTSQILREKYAYLLGVEGLDEKTDLDEKHNKLLGDGFQKSIPGICVYMTEQQSEQIKGILSSYIYYHSFKDIVIEHRNESTGDEEAVWGARGDKIDEFIEFISTLNLSAAIETAYVQATDEIPTMAADIYGPEYDKVKTVFNKVSQSFSEELADSLRKNLDIKTPERSYGGRENAFGGTIPRDGFPWAFSMMDSVEILKLFLHQKIDINFTKLMNYLREGKKAPRHKAIFSNVKSSNWVTLDINGNIFEDNGSRNNGTEYTLYFGKEQKTL